MVDGFTSLLYSSLVKVSHYRLFCFSRICIFFLFSSQSLLNLLTLFLISYVFSQISNLLSLSLPLSLFYLLLFPFLTSHAPFTPQSTRATTDFPPPRSVSLSKLRFPFPSATPTNARFTPIELSPLQCHPFSRNPTSPPPPLTDLFSRFIPFEYTRTDRRSPSRRWSRCLSPTPCSATSQSGCLPRALLTATLVREKILPDASRVTTTVSSTIVARDIAIVAVFLPRETADRISTWYRCVSFLDKTILYYFYQCTARNVKSSSDPLVNRVRTCLRVQVFVRFVMRLSCWSRSIAEQLERDQK